MTKVIPLSMACVLVSVTLGHSADLGVERRDTATRAESPQQRRLRSRVWPQYAQAPAVVRIEVLIEPDDDNRALEIVIDSGEYFRSSSIPLEGNHAARFHTVQYRSLPAGVYDIEIGLRGHSGAMAASEHRLLEVIP